LQLLHESFFNKGSDGVSASEEFKLIDDQDLQASKATLIEMGFGVKEAEKALKKNKFSVQNAIDWLVGKKIKGKESKSDKNEEDKEMNDELALLDAKHILFSNISGKDLKYNNLLNYFRYLIYGIDSVQSFCCICRDRLPKPSTKIVCCEKEL
jgi:hypothetical protein